MKYFNVIALTVAASVLFCASANATVNETAALTHDFTLSEKSQKQFENMAVDLVANGFGKMNIDKVKSYYNEDSNLRFADADGPFHKGWAEYKVWLGKIFNGMVDKQNFLTRDVHSIRLADNMVLTTLIIDNKTRLTNGDMVDSAMRLTFVWMQSDKSWKIIHEHFSLWHGELANLMGYPDTGRQQVTLD